MTQPALRIAAARRWPRRQVHRRQIRDLTRDGLRQRDGFQSLLSIVDAQLKRLSELDAQPALAFIALPQEIVRRHRPVRTFRKGIKTVWNLRAAIK